MSYICGVAQSKLLARYDKKRKSEKAARKDTAPLYVMLAPEQLARFKEAAAASHMTLKDWVSNALDTQVSQQSMESIAFATAIVEAVPDPGFGSSPDVEAIRTYVTQHGIRLAKLEAAVASLRQLLESRQP